MRATRCGRQRRLARMMSFMSSRSGLEVNMPVYRYSSTARMQLLLVYGNTTCKARKRAARSEVWP